MTAAFGGVKIFRLRRATVAFGDKGLPDEGRRDEDAPSEDFPDFLEAKRLFAASVHLRNGYLPYLLQTVSF